MRKLIIIGSGGHSRPVLNVALTSKSWFVEGVIDLSYREVKEDILGIPVLGGLDFLEKIDTKDASIFIAVGDNHARRRVVLDLDCYKFSFPNIIHPSAFVSNFAEVGVGIYVGPFAHIGAKARIGDFGVVNTFANLEHEVKVGKFAQFASNSVICGRCNIAENVFVGANATVINNISIAKNTIIGAGSVVVRDIVDQGQKIVGVPGRAI